MIKDTTWMIKSSRTWVGLNEVHGRGASRKPWNGMLAILIGGEMFLEHCFPIQECLWCLELKENLTDQILMIPPPLCEIIPVRAEWWCLLQKTILLCTSHL
uniref:Putative rhamnose biosynthetic enzyme 1 n=1 Tax=Rhizophora mucronata TaxID=61149 RepID=A0A2P2Q7M4_RHIMU